MSDDEDFGPRPPPAAAARPKADSDSESEMGPPRPPAAAAASAEKKKGPSKPPAAGAGAGAEAAAEAPSSGSRGGRGSDRDIYQRVPRTGSLKLKGSGADKKKKREMMRAVVPGGAGGGGGGGEDEVNRMPDGKRNWIEHYPERANYKEDIEAEKAKARELRRMNVVGGPSTAKAKDWARDYMMRGGAADQQAGTASARLNERIKKKTDKFCK